MFFYGMMKAQIFGQIRSMGWVWRASASVCTIAAKFLYLRVPLIGRHSVHTALTATALGLVEGLTWEEIIEGLHLPQTQLRLSF